MAFKWFKGSGKPPKVAAPQQVATAEPEKVATPKATEPQKIAPTKIAIEKNKVGTDEEWGLVEKENPSIVPLDTGRPIHTLLRRSDHSLPGSRIFTLQNFLSAEECDYYIKESQKIGYSSLAKEFQEEYRNNKRLAINCPELAAHIWKLISYQFIDKDLEGVTPFGSGNQGFWRAVGVGAWFKFSEYHPKTYFKTHMDSSYVINADLQSVYTIMIYLNDDFEGGRTAFFSREDVDGTGRMAFTLVPRKGQAVVFNHDTRHAGLEVSYGVKYIMRTEVLFERLSEPSIAADPSQITAKALFDRADFLERKGEFVEACGFHLQAMELQVQRGSFDWQEAREGIPSNRVAWPLSKETYASMCQFLSLQEIAVLCCSSKRHYLLSRDGGLWKQLYQQTWPNAYFVETNNAVAMQGWYPRFKSAWLTSHKFCPMIFDFGSCFTKLAMIGHHQRERPLPVTTTPRFSVVGTEYRVHCSIIGNGEDDLIRIGDEVSHVHCTNLTFPFIQDTSCDRFVRGLYARARIKSPNHPVLLALPMHMSPYTVEAHKWQRGMKAIFFGKPHSVPSMGFVDSAVAVIVDAKLKDGACVSVGYRYIVVAGVRNGKRVFTASIPSPWRRLLGGTPTYYQQQRDFVRSASGQDTVVSDSLTWVLTSPELGPNGLAGFVCSVFQEGAGSAHKDLLAGLVLCGGVTSIPDFVHRFKTALMPLLLPQEKELLHWVEVGHEAQVVVRGAASIAQSADIRTLFQGPEIRSSQTGATPLLSACFNNDVAEVKRLLQEGADPENIEGKYKQTALMIAASRGHAHVCQILLAYGANTAAKDRDNWTALEIAQCKGHAQVLALLENPGSEIKFHT